MNDMNAPHNIRIKRAGKGFYLVFSHNKQIAIIRQFDRKHHRHPTKTWEIRYWDLAGFTHTELFVTKREAVEEIDRAVYGGRI